MEKRLSEYSAQMGYLYQPHQSLGNIPVEEEKEERASRWERMLWNSVFWTGHDCCIHELTEAMVNCIRSGQPNFWRRWERGYPGLPLNEELLVHAPVGERIVFCFVFLVSLSGRFPVLQEMAPHPCIYKQHYLALELEKKEGGKEGRKKGGEKKWKPVRFRRSGSLLWDCVS